MESYFFTEEPDGYFEGSYVDFRIIVPLAQIAEKGRRQQSSLEKVKEYILRQL